MPPDAILPPATLGLLGGGQLGRFFALAAAEMGYRVWVLDPDPASPAGRIAHRHLCASYGDGDALDELAAGCRAITTEFENVPAGSLRRLAAQCIVRPGAAAVAICQDRIAEKEFLARHGFPVGEYVPVRRAADLDGAAPALFPGILKRARLGYDGKGQVPVGSGTEAAAAWQALGETDCVLEARLPLELELSVVLARGADGATAVYPPAENTHRNGILDVSIAPGRMPAAIAEQAIRIAGEIAGALAYEGTLAVEFFLSGGRLLVNELAPRPHNSGHWTLDACAASQYEQQVRALCGLPLASSGHWSSAVMVNLLGELWREDREPDWAELLVVPELKLHLYGKEQARPGRKMGHYTVVGHEPSEVLELAVAVRRRIAIDPGAGKADP